MEKEKVGTWVIGATKQEKETPKKWRKLRRMPQKGFKRKILRKHLETWCKKCRNYDGSVWL